MRRRTLRDHPNGVSPAHASEIPGQLAERPHLATLLDDMRGWGDRAPAVVEHRGVRRSVTSYGALAVLAHRFAAELTRRAIVPGERVVLWGANSAEWIAAFFGCVRMGVLPVPLDASGTEAFALRIIEEVQPRLIVGDGRLLRTIKHVPKPQLHLDALAQFLPAENAHLPLPSLSSDSPLQILFTSGTTGEPKGVVQTHGNLLASLGPIERELVKYRRYERWVHPLRFLNTLPLSHVFGQFIGLWVAPLLGASVVYESRIQAAPMLGLLSRERVHVLCAVPRTLALLRAQILSVDPALHAELAAAHSLPVHQRWWRFRRVHRALGLRFWAVVCGGATLPAEVEQFWTTLGVALVQGYGLTETAALVTLNHPFQTARGSLGKPLPGRSLRLNADGELEVKGAMVATARWVGGRMVASSPPAGTMDAEQGWLATGDLAALEPDGRVRFLGRTGQRLVTAAGLNVYLQDVERALEQQPGLSEAMVLGHRERDGEEQVAAIVVAGGGRSAASAAVAAANSKLAPHQQVGRWWLWPGLALPRTATGKVQRSLLESWVTRQAPGASGPEPSGLKPHGQEDTATALLRCLGLNATIAEAVNDDARLDADWGLDSMGRAGLAAALLEQTGGFFQAEMQLAQLQTLGELRALLREPQGTPPASVQGAAATPCLEAADITALPSDDSLTAMAASATNAIGPEALSLEDGRAAQGQAVPGGSAAAHPHRYPEWPWWRPVAWLRVLFLELLLRPLVLLLAAPRVTHYQALSPRLKPMLLICNHRTAMDLPLLLYGLPFRIRCRVAVAMSGEMLAGWQQSWTRRTLTPSEAKHRRWWGPLAAFALTTLFNVFPLPRTRGFRRSFTHAGRALDRGYHVLLFPEGRRSPAAAMLAFKPGLGILAQEAAAAILPLALDIKYKQPAAANRWFRSQPLLHIGTPVLVDAEHDPARITERLQREVAALLSEPARADDA